MPLIALLKSAAETVRQMSIEQLVANAGDGNLRDQSPASAELREYLAQVETKALAEYADHCLSRSFTKNGFVLQDIINELGRRLEYKVENGRYQGTTNEIGNDGIWTAPEGNAVVLEVKTTDAYRINLDTIAGYRTRLMGVGKIKQNSSILIVVGRSDTGDIEAQVRGSKHAWDIRLISVDALVKLVGLKESGEDEDTAKKIRGLLIPFEYTRLDNIIDAMFTTARDLEISGDTSQAVEVPVEAVDTKSKERHTQERTALELIASKRKLILKVIGEKHSIALIAKGRALFWSADHKLRVACSISKRYDRAEPYWYAYHPNWDAFLADGDVAYFALGCVDLDIAFVIPRKIIAENLQFLSTSTRENGMTYWHIKITEPARNCYGLQLPLAGKSLTLSNYVVNL